MPSPMRPDRVRARWLLRLLPALAAAVLILTPALPAV